MSTIWCRWLQLLNTTNLSPESLDVGLELLPEVGLVGEVVDQKNLLEEISGAPVHDAVHGPEEDAPPLVVEHDDDAGLGINSIKAETIVKREFTKRSF